MQAQRRLATFVRHISVSVPAPRAPPTLELDFSPEVAEALAAGRPVVALESTIISHGMPYPQNLKMATEVEDIIRANGAVPATIAILAGRIRVGLDAAALEELAKYGPKCRKCSRRDFPIVMAEGGNGATTVAGTMLVAQMAGIRVFVTGGVGGVHRGAEETFDISADLIELGKTPIGIVCAGVKSILDIPKTLEVLETQGVAVVSVGTDNFPAFFTPDSGSKAPFRADTPAAAAKILRATDALGLDNGTLFVQPIPADKAANTARVTAAIEQALKEAKEQGVEGKDATPFLLKRVNEISGGESLASNIELVKNNAKFGAKLAVEYCKLP